MTAATGAIRGTREIMLTGIRPLRRMDRNEPTLRAERPGNVTGIEVTSVSYHDRARKLPGITVLSQFGQRRRGLTANRDGNDGSHQQPEATVNTQLLSHVPD